MNHLIEQLIADWKSAAKSLRKAGGSENFWKADTYAYCAHGLELVLDNDRCLECGEPNGKHLPGCKMPKID